MKTFEANNSFLNYKTTSTPSVLYVASSPEVYGNVGGNCNQTSFSNVVPASTQAGDLIVVLLFARSSITNSDGFALLAQQANAGTTSGQYSAIYTKTATSLDIGRTVTFTQSVANRCAMTIMVFRSAVGALLLDAFSTNSAAASFPPLPNIPCSLQNSIAIGLSSTTSAFNIGDQTCSQYVTSFTAPPSYTQTTNSTGNACASCDNPRISAGYKLLVDSAETGDSDAFANAGVGSAANCAQIIAIFKDNAAPATTPIPRNLEKSASPTSDVTPFVSFSGHGTSTSPITGYVGGANSDNADKSLYLTALTTGTLNYNFTVSSEAGYDYGYLYVNNVLIFQIDGSQNRTGSVSITNGQQVRIRYTKDGSDSAGSDRLNINSLFIS